MILTTNNGQSAAKSLSDNISYEKGSTTIPSGSTPEIQAEKVALFNFYVLIDPRDNKPKYVGRTVNPKHRLRHHIWESKENNRNKKEKWIVKLLSLNLKPVLRVIHKRSCNIEKAIEIEKRLVLWLSKYFELKNSPDNYLGAVLTGKSVYQYDLNGNFVKEYPNSNQAYLATNIKDCNISRCCKNPNKSLSSGNYMWSYIKYEKFPLKYDSLWRNKTGKPILVFDKNDNFLAEYKTARLASIATGVGYKHISAICNNTKSGNRTKYNFKFK